MPWRMEREGSSLRVHIACPVDDWGVLFDQIEHRLGEEQGVLVIEMPERLPGASPLDADILVVLRRMLDHKPGITVR
ncbi:MAG TPA: hypothetical protein VHW68_11300 [Actinomycetota bacterium]|nr:hypothetical protein [Actinomycetota bacterium]